MKVTVLIHSLTQGTETLNERKLQVVVERLVILNSINLEVSFPEKHEHTTEAGAVLQEILQKLLVIMFQEVYELDPFSDRQRQNDLVLLEFFHLIFRYTVK